MSKWPKKVRERAGIAGQDEESGRVIESMQCDAPRLSKPACEVGTRLDRDGTHLSQNARSFCSQRTRVWRSWLLTRRVWR